MLKKIFSIKVSLSTVVLIILSIATALAVYWIDTDKIYAEYNSSNQITAIQRPGQSFAAEGILTKNKAGMSKGDWYLEYQRKSQGTIDVRLIFVPASFCKLADQNKKCSEVTPQKGWRVLITGRINNKDVTVDKLEII